MKVEVLDSKKANVLISRFNLNATQHNGMYWFRTYSYCLPKYTSYFLCYGKLINSKENSTKTGRKWKFLLKWSWRVLLKDARHWKRFLTRLICDHKMLDHCAMCMPIWDQIMHTSILKSHKSQWKLKAVYQGKAPMELKYPGSSVKTYSCTWNTQSAFSKHLP